MTIREASSTLGITRQRLTQLTKSGEIPSRLELGAEGRAQRMFARADVDAYRRAREEAATRQTGKGRPIKLPD